MAVSSFLSVADITVGYSGTPVLHDVSLDIAEGEFIALLGSSGCGKTTLLRTIAGFLKPSSGAIRVGSRDITDAPPDKRGMALMFQSYALWPHMTVAQNIGYGLKLKRLPKDQIGSRVGEMVDLLGLTDLMRRKPAQLSGGQKQRVALGRALAVSPQILLLDEPLSNLDARIRLTVRHEIRMLQQRLGITAIHVTHDREEAMVMADRIVILDAGRIAQVGAPQEVYNAPASAFVGAFMGAENSLVLTGRCRGDRYEIAAGPHNAAADLPLAGRAIEDGAVEALFRSDAAALRPAGAAPVAQGVMLTGKIVSASYPGGHWRHAVRLAGMDILVNAPEQFAPGTDVGIEVPNSALFLFSPGNPGSQSSAQALDRPVRNIAS